MIDTMIINNLGLKLFPYVHNTDSDLISYCTNLYLQGIPFITYLFQVCKI